MKTEMKTFKTLQIGDQFSFCKKPAGMKQSGWLKVSADHYREASTTDAYRFRVYEDFQVIIEDRAE